MANTFFAIYLSKRPSFNIYVHMCITWIRNHKFLSFMKFFKCSFHSCSQTQFFIRFIGNWFQYQWLEPHFETIFIIPWHIMNLVSLQNLLKKFCFIYIGLMTTLSILLQLRVDTMLYTINVSQEVSIMGRICKYERGKELKA